MMRQRFMTRVACCTLSALALFTVAACVTGLPSPSLPVRQEAPPIDTNIYFYPQQGHTPVTAEQQDRDRYECNAWSVQQTGFDPSLTNVPPHQRVHTVSVASGATSVPGGAVTGALVGAAVANPWHRGEGGLIGAIAGAAIGGIADAERTAEAGRVAVQANAQAAALEQKALAYRRAITACLEGRGYSVQ